MLLHYLHFIQVTNSFINYSHLSFRHVEPCRMASDCGFFCFCFVVCLFVFRFLVSYRVNYLYHCRICALSVAITFPFTQFACAFLATSHKCTISHYEQVAFCVEALWACHAKRPKSNGIYVTIHVLWTFLWGSEGVYTGLLS